MKKTLTLLFLLPFTKILAQSPVEQVINAEKSFAEMSRTQGTKKAFLTYIDNECVGYHNGNEVNVYDEWEKRRADSSSPRASASSLYSKAISGRPVSAVEDTSEPQRQCSPQPS